MKVCVIPKTVSLENSDLDTITDRKWLLMAEVSGEIYSLQEFEDFFNGKNYSPFIISSFTHFIKFIND